MTKPRLHTDDIRVGYDKSVVSENLTVEIPDGKFTVIVGPNACGKSTLLRAPRGCSSPLVEPFCWTEKRFRRIRRKKLPDASACFRRPPSHPTAFRWPISLRGAAIRIRS